MKWLPSNKYHTNRERVVHKPPGDWNVDTSHCQVFVDSAFRCAVRLPFPPLSSPRRVKLFRQRGHLERGRLEGGGGVVCPQHRPEPLYFHFRRDQGVASLAGFVLRVLRRTLLLWLVLLFLSGFLLSLVLYFEVLELVQLSLFCCLSRRSQ